MECVELIAETLRNPFRPVVYTCGAFFCVEPGVEALDLALGLMFTTNVGDRTDHIVAFVLSNSEASSSWHRVLWSLPPFQFPSSAGVRPAPAADFLHVRAPSVPRLMGFFVSGT